MNKMHFVGMHGARIVSRLGVCRTLKIVEISIMHCFINERESSSSEICALQIPFALHLHPSSQANQPVTASVNR